MGKQNRILIYTDGGCKGNPGPGGWAFILQFDNKVVKDSGAKPYTTNNKMELQAVIEGLLYANSVDPDGNIHTIVVTDSQYVKNGITTWVQGWKKNGWKTTTKKDVKNKELWIELDQLNSNRTCEWRWVKGHSGDPLNEECDQMVGFSIAKLSN